MREEHGGQDAGDERAHVADLLGEADGELLLGLGLGLVGRVLEQRRSISARDRPAPGRVGDALTMYQPVLPLPSWRASSK